MNLVVRIGVSTIGHLIYKNIRGKLDMIIKKFTAKSEAEATAAARKALGEGAVIMNVKDLKKKGLIGIFSQSQVEVTAAVEEINDMKVSNEKPVQVPSHLRIEREKPDQEKDDVKAPEHAEHSLDESALEQKLESLHTLIEKQMKSSTEKDEQKEDGQVGVNRENDETKRFFDLIRDTLEDNEVSGKYARALLEEIEKLNKPGVTIDYLLSNIYQKLVLKFGETKLINKTSSKAEVIFFVGPTGVGKTTTIAKIASKFCVTDRAKVALLTTDTYRVKAAEQLRTYADILDVPFRIIYEQEDLTKSLKEFENYDFILVDTAGHSPQNNEQIETQKQFMELADAMLPMQVYLVLSVTTKYRDLIHIVDKYKRDKGYRLIFTKLDETMALGNMLNLKIYTGADVSYVTNGQDVPDDIQEFNAQRIVRTLLDTK